MSKTAKEVCQVAGDDASEGSEPTEPTVAKRSFTRRTSHSKIDAYVALASASRVSVARAAERRFVTDSPPTAMVFVVSAFSSASGRTPSSLAEILSAALASPNATLAKSSSPSSPSTSSNVTFPSHSVADATRNASRVSAFEIPIERSDCFVASYAAASDSKHPVCAHSAEERSFFAFFKTLFARVPEGTRYLYSAASSATCHASRSSGDAPATSW